MMTEADTGPGQDKEEVADNGGKRNGQNSETMVAGLGGALSCMAVGGVIMGYAAAVATARCFFSGLLNTFYSLE